MLLNHGPIIVPLDGSLDSESALAPALRLSRAFDAPLAFVHVMETAPRDHRVSPTPGKFDEYVKRLLAERGGADCNWSAHLSVGHAANAILDAAVTARLVVMATHGHGGVRAALLGSVTDKVVRSCQLPVMTVPSGGTNDLGSGPILVGLDGSEMAEAALPVARDLAVRLGLGIALVRAYSMPPTAEVEFMTGSYDTIEVLAESAEAYLKSVARESEQTFVVMSSPARAIQQTADELGSGLVVLTPHGRGAAYRLALGSTTDRVVHSLRRPLLVVPGPPGGGPG